MPTTSLRMAVLAGGGLLTALLVDGGAVGYHWLPALLGATLLAAAAASRSRGALWGPGLVLLGAGASIGAWFQAGRSGADQRLLGLTALGLGLGAVVAAALARRLDVGPMSIALPVLLFGALVVLEQSGPVALRGRAWPYALLLVGLGAASARGYPREVPPP